MWKGFLGYQPLFLMDLVLLSQVIIIPLLFLAIYFAKKGNYKLHSRLLLVLTLLLLIAVISFELEIRHYGGLPAIAKMVGKEKNTQTLIFRINFFIHLLLSGLVAPLWLYILYGGKKHFTFSNPTPNEYGKTHRFLGKIAFIGALLVGFTGAFNYYLAFIW
ncbi:MAG: DUF420 domain-containing protein [Planctomycetota bacterium]|nr:MAG: DUF420 domain-containing protein [Planctomycetota bacterium]